MCIFSPNEEAVLRLPGPLHLVILVLVQISQSEWDLCLLIPADFNMIL